MMAMLRARRARKAADTELLEAAARAADVELRHRRAVRPAHSEWDRLVLATEGGDPMRGRHLDRPDVVAHGAVLAAPLGTDFTDLCALGDVASGTVDGLRVEAAPQLAPVISLNNRRSEVVRRATMFDRAREAGHTATCATRQHMTMTSTCTCGAS